MSDTIIKVENLSKRFIISHQSRERYVSLRDTVAGRIKNIFSSNSNPETRTSKEEFWALKDLNFEIKRGDRVGIIGRNGAGKSTLLKLLSQITEPTKGRIDIDGRIASLLEVGTGFHPELTGRENVFLNGAILGMSRSEIRKKFDEIVAFAEVEQFLDTPVKRYSSGMYVRLAFAVAAHLEPEILIIDEVLAVGDAKFQKKCLGKMESVSKNDGRTILFVSHNIGVLTSLCNQGILLHKGSLISMGSLNAIVPKYFEINKDFTDARVSVEVLNPNEFWTKGKILNLKVSWKKEDFLNGCTCDIAFYTIDGIKIFAFESHRFMNDQSIPSDKNQIIFNIENIGLIDRDLRIDVGLKDDMMGNYKILMENALTISVPALGLQPYKVDGSIIVPMASITL